MWSGLFSLSFFYLWVDFSTSDLFPPEYGRVTTSNFHSYILPAYHDFPCFQFEKSWGGLPIGSDFVKGTSLGQSLWREGTRIILLWVSIPTPIRISRTCQMVACSNLSHMNGAWPERGWELFWEDKLIDVCLLHLLSPTCINSFP